MYNFVYPVLDSTRIFIGIKNYVQVTQYLQTLNEENQQNRKENFPRKHWLQKSMPQMQVRK